jgi:hypothetical protein
MALPPRRIADAIRSNGMDVNLVPLQIESRNVV